MALVNGVAVVAAVAVQLGGLQVLVRQSAYTTGIGVTIGAQQLYATLYKALTVGDDRWCDRSEYGLVDHETETNRD